MFWNRVLGICILIGVVFLTFILGLISSYLKEKAAARAWWKEQVRAEKQIDRRFVM